MEPSNNGAEIINDMSGYLALWLDRYRQASKVAPYVQQLYEQFLWQDEVFVKTARPAWRHKCTPASAGFCERTHHTSKKQYRWLQHMT